MPSCFIAVLRCPIAVGRCIRRGLSAKRVQDASRKFLAVRVVPAVHQPAFFPSQPPLSHWTSSIGYGDCQQGFYGEKLLGQGPVILWDKLQIMIRASILGAWRQETIYSKNSNFLFSGLHSTRCAPSRHASQAP